MERITIRNSSNVIIAENVAADLTAWLAANEGSFPDGYTVTRVNIDQEIAVKNALEGLKASRAFGVALVDAFAVENVVLGINAAQSDAVMAALLPTLTALSNGYLETAIRRVKEIDQNIFDGVFLSEARLLSYVNKIETFLGITLSTSL
jgi:hypothetical protein